MVFLRSWITTMPKLVCFQIMYTKLMTKGLFTREPRWVSSRDEKCSFYISVFIPGCRDVSRLARVEFISPRAYITLSFIPKRLFTWVFRHVLSRDEIMYHHVNSNKKMTRHRDEFIPGRKWSRDENSHVKRPFYFFCFYCLFCFVGKLF